ncbi:PREDICTED: synaptotagmin-like protein 5 [Nanorana parkeri]|uniref:synaptotagmin-like protein 5 n=1 Tax=Nanorana parkeri TaxID=125878 RepID=UPI000854B601|nr:PREDICTED: synaptotagmin-like protein 5 [Nanorana parkeri]
MSKNTEILNLSHLLDQERDTILAVLKRDENLKKIEDKRVRKLKNELLEVKKKGAKISRLRQHNAKICVRCQKKLGFIFDRGNLCQACQFRVCNTCRIVVKEGIWRCKVCAKIAQIRIATGDWFFEERSKRFKGSTVLGTEVVRKSIMRKSTAPTRIEEESEEIGKDLKENSAPATSEAVEGYAKRIPDKKSAKGEDSKSIRSNYDTQSLRSTRSMPRSDGLDKRPGKPTRSGEDAISIHSNHDTQSLRSVTSIPRSERRSKIDIRTLPEASQADYLQSGQDTGDGISQASVKMDSRSESKRSSPVSVIGSVHSLGAASINSAQTGNRSNGYKTNTNVGVHQGSPTPSKRSISSNYSHIGSIASGIRASSSIPEDMAKGHRRQNSGTPSLTLSRVSVASDRSRSELDLSGHYAEGKEETGSIKSKSISVPGGLNSDLEYLDENEEDFAATNAHKANTLSAYSMNAPSVSDKKWTHLSVPDADADTTSLNSMTSVYSEGWDYDSAKVSGELILNLSYSYKTGALNVLVKSCKNLATADEKKNRTDPYVKSYLLPDKSRQSKRKTKIKTNTTNPEFNEVLKYVISHTQLETRTLQLSVCHNDRFGRNSFLGEVNIPLDTRNFENQEDESFTLQAKMDMASDVTLQYKGEITVGLRYIPPEKNLTLPLEPVSMGKKSFRKSKKIPMPTGGILEVLIKEAKNLTAVKSGGTSDPFVKGYLLPDNNKSTKHKTSIIKKSVNPQWNHTFSFTSLEPSDLQNISLELTVWDKESLTSNVFLGGVCLSCGSGISYGNEVDWMDAQGEEQYLWQKMMDSPGTSVEGTLMLRSTKKRHKKGTQKS